MHVSDNQFPPFGLHLYLHPPFSLACRHLPIRLALCLPSTHLSSVHLFIHLSSSHSSTQLSFIHPSIHPPSAHLSILSSIHSFICPHLPTQSPSVCLSFLLHHISIHPSIHVSTSPAFSVRSSFLPFIHTSVPSPSTYLPIYY